MTALHLMGALAALLIVGLTALLCYITEKDRKP